MQSPKQEQSVAGPWSKQNIKKKKIWLVIFECCFFICQFVFTFVVTVTV